jgi:protein SCO1/2
MPAIALVVAAVLSGCDGPASPAPEARATPASLQEDCGAECCPKAVKEDSCCPKPETAKTVAEASCCPDPEAAKTVAEASCCPEPQTAKAVAEASCCEVPGEAAETTGVVASTGTLDTMVASISTTGKTGTAAASASAASPVPGVPPARVSPFMAADQRSQPFFLDFAMTRQDGTAMDLKDLIGKPFAVSFIFTSCSDPNMCPMITVQMANLQREVEKAGVGEDVRLALISYDPQRDTPEKLLRYGRDRGIRFDRKPEAMLLRPSVDQFRELISELAIAISPTADGSITHAIELLVVDHKGRYVRDYQAGAWDNAAVAADLKRLVEEQKAEAASKPLAKNVP